MKLTNKQLEIVVDEIYDRISVPIIEQNQNIINSIESVKDDYFDDLKEYFRLEDLKKAIDIQIEKLEEKMDLNLIHIVFFHKMNHMNCI